MPEAIGMTKYLPCATCRYLLLIEKQGFFRYFSIRLGTVFHAVCQNYVDGYVAERQFCPTLGYALQVR